LKLTLYFSIVSILGSIPINSLSPQQLKSEEDSSNSTSVEDWFEKSTLNNKELT